MSDVPQRPRIRPATSDDWHKGSSESAGQTPSYGMRRTIRLPISTTRPTTSTSNGIPGNSRSRKRAAAMSSPLPDTLLSTPRTRPVHIRMRILSRLSGLPVVVPAMASADRHGAEHRLLPHRSFRPPCTAIRLQAMA